MEFIPGGGHSFCQTVRVSRDVPPFTPLFSPQVHPLVGYSNVKYCPVGYQFLSASSAEGLLSPPACVRLSVGLFP